MDDRCCYSVTGPESKHLTPGKRGCDPGGDCSIGWSGSDLIDGETSQTLDAYEAFEVHSDGVSNWWIL